MMEEKVIKRSPKKIIWNALFGLASVLFFLLPLSYLHCTRKREPDFIR